MPDGQPGDTIDNPIYIGDVPIPHMPVYLTDEDEENGDCAVCERLPVKPTQWTLRDSEDKEG